MAMDNQPVGARLRQWASWPQDAPGQAAPVAAPPPAWMQPLGQMLAGTMASRSGQLPAVPTTDFGGGAPVYPAPAPVVSPVAAATAVPLVVAPAVPKGKAQASLGPKAEAIDSKQEYVPDRREDFIRAMQAGMMTTGTVAQMMQASPYIRPVPMRDIALGQYLQAVNAELTRHLTNPQATPEQRQAAVDRYLTRYGGAVSQSALMGGMIAGTPVE